MALYEFDENKIVKSSAIDENGYHRDGGCVFVEDIFYTSNTTYFFARALLDLNKHIKETVYKNRYRIGSCINYVYFGDEIIDNSEFELGLDPEDNKIKILNANNFEIFPNTNATASALNENLNIYSITLASDTVLPENVDNMKCHIIIVFKKCDENNTVIEGEYGVMQIHQK